MNPVRAVNGRTYVIDDQGRHKPYSIRYVLAVLGKRAKACLAIAHSLFDALPVGNVTYEPAGLCCYPRAISYGRAAYDHINRFTAPWLKPAFPLYRRIRLRNLFQEGEEVLTFGMSGHKGGQQRARA